MRELNPKLWDGLRLKPEVRMTLLKNALAFKKFMDAPGLKIDDVMLVGSSASRWWTQHSDIDLHLVVDFEQSVCPKWADGFFSAQKSLWNQTHDVTVFGHEVELYVEDLAKPANSAGAYSLTLDRWLREPGNGPMREDDPSVIAKADALEAEIEDILGGEASKEAVEELLDRLKRLRRDGLAADGEKSTENWAYKVLRSRKALYKLWAARKTLLDDDLSLNERMAPRVGELWLQEDAPLMSPAQQFVNQFVAAHGVTVKLEVLGPNEVQLVWIERTQAEKGAGGDEVEALCDLANELEVKISLVVDKDSAKLCTFYRNFGFKSLQKNEMGDIIMERPVLKNRRPKHKTMPHAQRGNFVQPWKRRVSETQLDEANKPKPYYHITPAANLENIMQHGLKPGYGPRSEAAAESAPAIYLFQSRADAEDAAMNWFGDATDEEEPLALIRVTLPKKTEVTSDVEYEFAVKETIPPKFLKVVTRNF